MTDAELVPVTRPNGRIYRPRKPPRAVIVENDYPSDREPGSWVFVLGTHDIERAHRLASVLAAGEGMTADMESAWCTWMRLAMRNGEQVFETDQIRGAASVMFDLV